MSFLLNRKNKKMYWNTLLLMLLGLHYYVGWRSIVRSSTLTYLHVGVFMRTSTQHNDRMPSISLDASDIHTSVNKQIDRRQWVWECMWVCVCVCVCVCARERQSRRETELMCLHVCVCVCERERERESERERNKKKKRDKSVPAHRIRFSECFGRESECISIVLPHSRRHLLRILSLSLSLSLSVCVCGCVCVCVCVWFWSTYYQVAGNIMMMMMMMIRRKRRKRRRTWWWWIRWW